MIQSRCFLLMQDLHVLYMSAKLNSIDADFEYLLD